MAGRTSRSTSRRRATPARAASTRRRSTRSSRRGPGHPIVLVAMRGGGGRAATARVLDVEHRRDGAGLFLLALASLLAVAVWFDGGGPVGEYVAMAVRRAVGAVAAFLPPLLVLGMVRLMRAPAG